MCIINFGRRITMVISMVSCKKISSRSYKLIVTYGEIIEEAILVCPIFKTKRNLTKRIIMIERSFNSKGCKVKFDQLWSSIISADNKFPDLF